MKKNNQWFRYEPADKNKEDKDVRMHIRNLARTSGLFSSMPHLTLDNLDMNQPYDEVTISGNDKKFKMKIYGNGNQIVKDSIIEYYCNHSERSIANKLIDELAL